MAARVWSLAFFRMADRRMSTQLPAVTRATMQDVTRELRDIARRLEAIEQTAHNAQDVISVRSVLRLLSRRAEEQHARLKKLALNL